EPLMYTDTEYPVTSVFPPLNSAIRAELGALTRSCLFDQLFGVLVSDTGPTAAITDLSSTDISSIFSGFATDWSHTLNTTTGLPNPAGPITVVRREPGWGSQVAAAEYFLHTVRCSPNGALAFVTDGSDADDGACTALNPSGGLDDDGVLLRQNGNA